MMGHKRRPGSGEDSILSSYAEAGDRLRSNERGDGGRLTDSREIWER